MSESVLYVSDLDGTLLDASAQLSAESARMLNEAIARGARFTVATARTPATVQPLLSALKVKPLPAIVMTGAAFWDFDKQGYVDPQIIPAHIINIIDAAFASSTLTPFVYTLDAESACGCELLRVYHNSVSPAPYDRKFIEQRYNLPLKRFCLGATVPASRCDKICLYFAVGPHEQVQRVAALVSEQTPCAVSCYEDIYNPGLGIVEIFAPGVSKANALRRLASAHGVDRIVAFGDNLNDLPMLEVADVSVAVENALPEVKTAASVIIGPNTADSVARYILQTL